MNNIELKNTRWKLSSVYSTITCTTYKCIDAIYISFSTII